MADWDKSTKPPPPNPAVVFLQVSLGAALVFVGHGLLLGVVLLGAWLGSSFQGLAGPVWMFGVFSVFGLGCAQGIYVVPLFVGGLLIRRPIALGVIIGATLTVLLQGGCYGLVALVPLLN